MHYLLYALTLLLSSALLFAVQPMVAKMVQPVLGGTPAVWNTAMVFFQALLLGGYIYAHVTTRWLGTRRQAVLHVVVMLVGLAYLPIAFEPPADTAALESPTPWLLATLLVGVGWPFFVVSTSAPLLQKWFSTIDHWRASDPYHLYAASNVGSVLALLAYPLVIEPRIGLQAQSMLWMAAYLVLCATVAVCAAVLWRSPRRRPDDDGESVPPAMTAGVDWHRRGRWLLWAFIPSSMMLSVTTFITTDIAPVPLLWIVPLAIYMLSFIAAFARRNPIPLSWWTTAFAPCLVAAAVVLFTGTTDPLWLITGVTLSALLVFCMVFHGLLAADRPHTDDLTEFYLWIAVGGVLGGAFNALLAPAVFDRLLEYPIVLFVAALAAPAALYRRRAVRLAMALSLLGAGVFVAYHRLADATGDLVAVATIVVGCVFFVGVPAVIQYRAPRWSPVLAAILVGVVTAGEIRPDPGELYAARSFFGTHQVKQSSPGHHHVLYHGRTIHGAQAREADLRDVPLSYYYYSGPLGQLFDELEHRPRRHPIAAVGLGTGAVATYSQPGQRLDFYEIDPVVEAIATDPALFSFVDDCPGQCRIIRGDGRLQLATADDAFYELIVLDAFSSAAIPVHLLTREALEIYTRKLREDGILAIHISNLYLDLEPPLARAVHDLGLVSRVQMHLIDDDDPLYDFFVDSSKWMLVARSEQAFGDLADDDRWQIPSPDPDIDAWTDDYANIVEIFAP